MEHSSTFKAAFAGSNICGNARATITFLKAT